jgi:DNA (cytosine-5)-methyltransferase 1
MAKGSGTRSGLLWEVERLLNEVDELPQVLLMENVPQVICDDFFEWCRFLEGKGYKNYYKLMNAKDYGVPQNRNRCFMVSLLGDYLYEFPAPFPLEKRLKDVLEDKVDEKYYISDKAVKYITKRLGKYTQLINDDTEAVDSAITAKGNQNWTGNFVDEGIIVKGNYSPSGHDASRIVDTEGLAPTKANKHDTSIAIFGGGTMNDIGCQEVGNLEGGMYDKIHEQSKRVYGTEGLSPTIHTMGGGGQEVKILDEQNNLSNIRIRKLTPRECWRLQDFTDEQFDRASKVNSDSQLYKQAGNSIVVNCLYLIFKEMM